MQPVPLTGTATDAAALPLSPDAGCSPCPSRGQQPLGGVAPCIRVVDAARTPHGDNNNTPLSQNILLRRCIPHPSRGQQLRCFVNQTTILQDAARTPHGDNNLALCCRTLACGQMQPVPLTGTTTLLPAFLRYRTKMQPVPLTGTTTKYGVYHRLISFADATRTPHGDNNQVWCLS